MFHLWIAYAHSFHILSVVRCGSLLHEKEYTKECGWSYLDHDAVEEFRNYTTRILAPSSAGVFPR